MTRLMKALGHEVDKERLGARKDALAVFGDVKKHIGKMVVLRAMETGSKAGDKLGEGQ